MQISSLSTRRTAVAAVLFAAACSDDGVRPADPVKQVPEPPVTAIETLQCTGSVNPLRVTCASQKTTAAGVNAVIIGRQGVYIFLSSSNVSYDPVGDTLAADVTVRNLLSQPMGTTDGVNADANGVRVFFQSGPTAPVTVAADGTGTFTASNEPYYQYGPSEFGGTCCLAPQATSTARRWKFDMNGASSFTFRVQVAAALPAEDGIYRWQTDYDPSALISHGEPVLDFATANGLDGARSAGALGVLGFRKEGGWLYTPLPNGASDRALRLYYRYPGPFWAVGANGIFWRTEANFNLLPLAFTPVYVGVTGMRDIHGSDTANVWAVGDSGRVLRLARAWGKVTQPGTVNLRAVFVFSTSNVWTAGEGGNLYHWTGSGWTTVAAPDTGTVNDLWGYSASAIWAVNVQQTASGPVSSIFFYNGTSWSVQRSGIAAPLRSLHGADPYYGLPYKVYAVGGNRMLRFNGSVWYDEYVPLAPGDSLYSVYVYYQQLVLVGGIGTTYVGTR